MCASLKTKLLHRGLAPEHRRESARCTAGDVVAEVVAGAAPGGWKLFQQDDEWTAQMAQQLPEKQANFLLPDIVEVKLIVQAQVLSAGTYGDSGNDRDLVAASLAMIVNRSTTLRGPRPDDVRDQEKARLVGED